jgi:hypothetical protein
MKNEIELVVKIATTAWEAQNAKVDTLLNTLPEEKMLSEIAPGKNRGIYLLGHLAAVNDNLLPLFGFGEKLYPQLGSVFLSNPDRSGLASPTLAELKQYWNKINTTLSQHIRAMKPSDWFEKHASISAEDFAKEPHRNKLSVLLNRTVHQSYHVGQLILLQSKTSD